MKKSGQENNDFIELAAGQAQEMKEKNLNKDNRKCAHEESCLHININGIVQGVGFRPFVYRLARSFKLTGRVINSGDGVQITICGEPETLDKFVDTLPVQAPPMARITAMTTQPGEASETFNEFSIAESRQTGKATVQITPDIALCEDCRKEITDPANRRHRYPFTNCTNCGPRFTIIRQVPYDRPHTSMSVFPMCPECESEYHDPMDRRFHAQPNACPVCGPGLSWHDQNGKAVQTEDCLRTAANALAAGKIVAIKGLGGFHLAANACSYEAVSLLRERKTRPHKPLAIMVKDLAAAEQICSLSAKERELLSSVQHPIVLLEKKDTSLLAENLSPNIGVIGVMLPYTPLHALLMNEESAPSALVMTSGNRAGAPICIDNDDAVNRLGGLADFFLLHNRDIVTRVDDSVARIVEDKVRLIRRARGYAPVPLKLNGNCNDILACGAEKKNTFCIVRNNEAYLSQHIGELTSRECFTFYEESINHLQTTLQYRPEHIACDQHPDYLSTRYARQKSLPITYVQHHHAHIGAVMAEHGLEGPVLGVILDGTGYSDDGTVFGGEVYLAERKTFTRMACLSQLKLPGGDKAAKEPWRMACALLYAGYGEQEWEHKLSESLRNIAQEHRDLISQMLAKNINSPLSSSCGRLFDAVAGLLGICMAMSYEGQAAMELEYKASCWAAKYPELLAQEQEAYMPEIEEQENLLQINSSSLARLIIQDLQQATDIGLIAFRFHWWLIRSICLVLKKLEEQTGVHQVSLSGGCMLNTLILKGLTNELSALQFTVHSGEMIPVNDGGIALGQAYIGGANTCV